ncbi:MAG: ABC transporter substrate-binding protein [Acidobacteria bacterium]|nr:ABC transporter substrate-binding protein [Acidobacteriota bacterium]
MNKSRQQTKNRWLFGLVLALMIFGFAACSTRKPEPDIANFHIVVDGLRREVRIQSPPKRIISLAPSVTEMLFGLGLGNRIVGVTSYCDFPEEARQKEKVGDTLNPNLERIIALKPDLIVITTASQLERLTQQLSNQNIPVYVVNPQTVRGIADSIFELGKATGATAQGEKLRDEMLRHINAVETRVSTLPKPKVLYVLQAAPLITAGRNTFITDLIRLAGGKSISADEPTDYPQLSRETAIARAPDVIVAPASHGTELVKESDLQRDFAVTPALKANRIVRVNPDWVDRPGPRIVDGLEQLAEGLHPTKQ